MPFKVRMTGVTIVALLFAALWIFSAAIAEDQPRIVSTTNTPVLPTIPPPGTSTATPVNRDYAPLVLDTASTPTVYLSPTCSPPQTPPPPAPGSDGSSVLSEATPTCGLGPTVTPGASPTSGPTVTFPPP
jgi:hypothetical protein